MIFLTPREKKQEKFNAPIHNEKFLTPLCEKAKHKNFIFL